MKNKNIKEYAEKQASLPLFPINNKSIDLSFNLELVSSDGGLLLLREVDKRIGLISSVSEVIKDDRDQRYIHHSLKEMISQRVYQITAGYEDCNDCDDLRNDSILKICSDRLPSSEGALASQPTMCRLENSISKTELLRVGLKLVDLFISSYSE